ncbi:TrkA C-terminal domain-containing protein [Haloarchaeobius sp. HRN-SO-5]|uniref:Lrp/AsnC family transcriptional regulator n=1 Tax=Haloarchaeobius sp. HRN-SO-5 TaxID=3446118 RepID=UPI003EBB26B8
MPGEYRIDEIDKRILYHLAADARKTSASLIAEEVDVTPPTIRNRIRQLEDHGIIEGYHAAIDYERTNGRTKTQFTCTAPTGDRQRLAQEVLGISGVVGVRELLAGRGNLLVTVVTTDSDESTRIGQELSELGLDVEEVDTIHNDLCQPYHSFAPEKGHRNVSLTDFRSLSGSAEVVEFTVSEDAEFAGRTIAEASDTELLEDLLVVSIERGDDTLTPKGDTVFQAGDVVTIFSREAIPQRTIHAFDSQMSNRT